MDDRIIAVSTVPFDGYPMEVAFERIARLGAQSVETAFIQGYMDEFSEEIFSPENARRVRNLLKNSGLTCPVLSAHMDLGSKGAVQVFGRRMEFASEIGAGIIISNAAARSEEKAFFENIVRLGAVAQSLEMTIALENPGDGRKNLLDTARDGAELISRIGNPSVRLNYDFANPESHLKQRVNLEVELEALAPFAAYYHIKDVLADESGWRFPEIGRGSIDWATILPRLKEDDTPLGLEIPLRMRRLADAAPRRRASPVSLQEIDRVLSASWNFLLDALELR
jgi:sugar phosphate isomerase/epimerase